MNDTAKNLVNSYFTQQAQLGIAEYLFADGLHTQLRGSPENAGRPASAGQVPADNPPSHTAAEISRDAKRAALIELYYEVKNCRGCPLCQTRHSMVFGSGNVHAPLMIIGEAPGEEEDKQGKPFVGRAGELLTKMLQAINLDRERDVFITNILKCRPPLNRDPNQAEVSACIPILKRQIAIIKPQAILVLGRIAVDGLLHLSEGIGKLRTTIHYYDTIPVIITYHPAALLRNESYKRPAWEDMKKLRDILKQKGAYDNRS